MNFDFNEYVKTRKIKEEVFQYEGSSDFQDLCADVKEEFFRDWEKDGGAASLEIQKRAIIGYEKEKEFFKTRIGEIISESGRYGTGYPSWYESLEDAVYQENWGLAGLSEWFSEKYKNSSSAKLIGNRIYFMEDGHMVLKPQTVSEERISQMIKAFLLLTPEERMDKDYYETYLLDGTRVTVFTEPLSKKKQPCMVFRRYLIPDYSFEEQAKRNTIPKECTEFLKAMVSVGYNVVFMGAVRSAKTTFLSTWQSYEDDSLEGVMVETDPEIPMHKILPDAPILQLIADGDELKAISKSLLRSDADYFILAEARDGIALDTAVKIAAKGTKRMKLTFHSRNPKNFPLEAATEIVKATGGDLKLTMQMVASSFDILFYLIQLPDKNQKRLKGIYCMECGPDGTPNIHPICEYDIGSDSWSFYDSLDEELIKYGMESSPQGFEKMMGELKRLAGLSPIKND